jgi:hypothetical protein
MSCQQIRRILAWNDPWSLVGKPVLESRCGKKLFFAANLQTSCICAEFPGAPATCPCPTLSAGLSDVCQAVRCWIRVQSALSENAIQATQQFVVNVTP